MTRILSLFFGQVHVRVHNSDYREGSKLSRELYGQNIWLKASELKAVNKVQHKVSI